MAPRPIQTEIGDDRMAGAARIHGAAGQPDGRAGNDRTGAGRRVAAFPPHGCGRRRARRARQPGPAHARDDRQPRCRGKAAGGGQARHHHHRPYRDQLLSRPRARGRTAGAARRGFGRAGRHRFRGGRRRARTARRQADRLWRALFGRNHGAGPRPSRSARVHGGVRGEPDGGDQHLRRDRRARLPPRARHRSDERPRRCF